VQCNRVFNRDHEASKARATGLQLDLSVTVRFAHPDATAVCTLSALLIVMDGDYGSLTYAHPDDAELGRENHPLACKTGLNG
jgi:hypothetical protein